MGHRPRHAPPRVGPGGVRRARGGRPRGVRVHDGPAVARHVLGRPGRGHVRRAARLRAGGRGALPQAQRLGLLPGARGCRPPARQARFYHTLGALYGVCGIYANTAGALNGVRCDLLDAVRFSAHHAGRCLGSVRRHPRRHAWQGMTAYVSNSFPSTIYVSFTGVSRVHDGII